MSQITHFISVIPAMEAVRLVYLKHSKRCAILHQILLDFIGLQSA